MLTRAATVLVMATTLWGKAKGSVSIHAVENKYTYFAFVIFLYSTNIVSVYLHATFFSDAL